MKTTASLLYMASATGAIFTASLGQRPRICATAKTASAESAIHSRRRLDHSTHSALAKETFAMSLPLTVPPKVGRKTLLYSRLATDLDHLDAKHLGRLPVVTCCSE